MPENPLLQKGFTSGWIQKFFNDPFDPLCVMLAMRTRMLLDAIDEMGKSYNLMRRIGYGWVDFGEIPGEIPGDPDSYYPPEINNPVIITGPTISPGPGEPGYVPPGPGPGEPGYTGPGPGEPGYVAPLPGPGETGYTPPMPGEPGYIPPGGEEEGTWSEPWRGGMREYFPPPPPPPEPPPPEPPAPGPPAPGPPAPGPPAGGKPAPGPPAGGKGGAQVGGGAGSGHGGGGGGSSPGGGAFGFGPGTFGPGETGRSGSASRGGVGPDCCVDKDNILQDVSIGSYLSEMECGGVQVFTVSGYDPTCTADNYSWNISVGAGVLVEGDYEATYTAAECGAACVSPVTIQLLCKGAVVDEAIIYISTCPLTASIGYQSLQMQVNESQTLSVVPGNTPCGAAEYTWTLTSGGGSLSSNSGASTIYTAPATNAGCSSNPTITLACGGTTLDTLQLAVNASSYSSGIMQVWHDASCTKIADGPPPIYAIRIWNSYTNCLGDVVAGYPCEAGFDAPQGWDCNYAYAHGGCFGCLAANKTINVLLATTPIDERWPDLITEGCCPDAAL